MVVGVLIVHAQPKGDTVGTVTQTRQTMVHDPVMIQQGVTYYLFCTGWGISFFSSKDLQHWKK